MIPARRLGQPAEHDLSRACKENGKVSGLCLSKKNKEKGNNRPPLKEYLRANEPSQRRISIAVEGRKTCCTSDRAA